jgi:hypothetical protein
MVILGGHIHTISFGIFSSTVDIWRDGTAQSIHGLRYELDVQRIMTRFAAAAGDIRLSIHLFSKASRPGLATTQLSMQIVLQDLYPRVNWQW